MFKVPKMPNPDKPEPKKSHAKAQRRKENLQLFRNLKNASLIRETPISAFIVSYLCVFAPLRE